MISVLSLLCSCVREEVEGPNVQPHCDVTFSLQMPRSYAAAAGTGLTDQEESMISDLTILLFTAHSSGDQKCIAVIEDLSPTVVPGTDYSQYRVNTPVTVGTYYFMLLANVPGKLTGATTVGSLRSDIENTLLEEMQSKWDIYSHTGFPMWGASEGEIIVSGKQVVTDEIQMLRMLSRINISVDDVVQDQVKLNTIRLHNPSGRGLVIPDDANLDKTTTPGYIRAVSPTLPLDASGNEDPQLLSTPWQYTSADIEDQARCLNTIYAMEGFDPAGRDEDEYAWLEVLATYIGGDEKSYRIDFGPKDSNGNRTLMPLLRNHTYDITIEGVDEIRQEMEVTVQVWDDGDMSEIIVEGQYSLKVNQATFNFDRELRDTTSFNNNLQITTNHEDGWEITRVTDPNDNDSEIDMDTGWLQIRPEHRKGPQGETTIKLFLEKNDGAARSAEIHLQVGRLIDFIVKVNQSTSTVLELAVEDLEGNSISELFFYEYYGWEGTHQPKDIRVRWSPKGERIPGTNYHCNVEIHYSGDEDFKFDPQGNPIIAGHLTNEDGSQHYSISPQGFTEAEVAERGGNPFLHRGMRVIFTVTDENNPNNSISKTVYLRHQHFAIISRNIRREAKLGRSYRFNVLSNTSWEVSSVDDEGILSTTPSGSLSGGNNIVTGDPIDFTTVNPNTTGTVPATGQAGRKVTMWLKDKQGYIPDPIPFTVTGVYPDPNSYILNPASANINDRRANIPIRKLFQAWEYHAEQPVNNLAQGQLEAQVIWNAVFLNSSPNGTPQNYTIQSTIIQGSGGILDDILQVTIPQNANISGNAVVGVRRTGTTQWLYSWHIWITPWDPDSDPLVTTWNSVTHRLMKRPLGAIEYNENITAPSNRGLYYQWGRKDPLRENFITSSAPIVTSLNNIGNALNNPSTLYLASGTPEDWATNSRDHQHDYMWNDIDNEKGIFDPCPEGWKISGPKHGEVESQWTNLRPADGTFVNGKMVTYIIRDNTTGQYIHAPTTGYYDIFGNKSQHPDIVDESSVNHYLGSPSTENPIHGVLISSGLGSPNFNIFGSFRSQAATIRCARE